MAAPRRGPGAMAGPGPGAAPPRLALALALLAALLAAKYYRDTEAARQQVPGTGYRAQGRGRAGRSEGEWRARPDRAA